MSVVTAATRIDTRRRKGLALSALATVDSSAKAAPRERAANDWYCEEPWAVEGLFDVQRFSGWAWDPACGRGTIPEICKAHGLRTLATDLVDRGYGIGGHDFLTMNLLDDLTVDNIITNPPYDDHQPEAFLKRALGIARHKVAMLLRWSWAEGRRRRWVWDETPLAAIHPFAHRVSMPPGGLNIKPKGGAVAFAWFVWDHDWPKGMPPIVRRIERGPAADSQKATNKNRTLRGAG